MCSRIGIRKSVTLLLTNSLFLLVYRALASLKQDTMAADKRLKPDSLSDSTAILTPYDGQIAQNSNNVGEGLAEPTDPKLKEALRAARLQQYIDQQRPYIICDWPFSNDPISKVPLTAVIIDLVERDLLSAEDGDLLQASLVGMTVPYEKPHLAFNRALAETSQAHRELVNRIQECLSSSNDIDSLVFEGPEGARLTIGALLEKLRQGNGLPGYVLHVLQDQYEYRLLETGAVDRSLAVERASFDKTLAEWNSVENVLSGNNDGGDPSESLDALRATTSALSESAQQVEQLEILSRPRRVPVRTIELRGGTGHTVVEAVVADENGDPMLNEPSDSADAVPEDELETQEVVDAPEEEGSYMNGAPSLDLDLVDTDPSLEIPAEVLLISKLGETDLGKDSLEKYITDCHVAGNFTVIFPHEKHTLAISLQSLIKFAKDSGQIDLEAAVNLMEECFNKQKLAGMKNAIRDYSEALVFDPADSTQTSPEYLENAAILFALPAADRVAQGQGVEKRSPKELMNIIVGMMTDEASARKAIAYQDDTLSIEEHLDIQECNRDHKSFVAPINTALTAEHDKGNFSRKELVALLTILGIQMKKLAYTENLDNPEREEAWSQIFHSFMGDKDYITIAVGQQRERLSVEELESIESAADAVHSPKRETPFEEDTLEMEIGPSRTRQFVRAALFFLLVAVGGTAIVLNQTPQGGNGDNGKPVAAAASEPGKQDVNGTGAGLKPKRVIVPSTKVKTPSAAPSTRPNNRPAEKEVGKQRENIAKAAAKAAKPAPSTQPEAVKTPQKATLTLPNRPWGVYKNHAIKAWADEGYTYKEHLYTDNDIHVKLEKGDKIFELVFPSNYEKGDQVKLTPLR